MTVKELEKALIKRLPKNAIHDKFGICWDKKDTYTIKEFSRENFKNTITPSSILKVANINNFEEEFKDKLTVIVYSFQKCKRNEIEVFNLLQNKKVDNYIEHYIKGDVLPDLKNAEEIIVIQVNRNSLNLPEYTKKRDIDFYSSTRFNEDSSLYDRIKFLNRTMNKWNPETKAWEETLVSLDDLMNYDARVDLDVQIISTNKKFSLRKTIGSSQEQKWSELIDKSGYNRNAKLIKLHFALAEFKANKIREEIKNGNLISIKANISMLLSTLKYEISVLLNRIEVNNELEIAESYLGSLLTFKREYKRIENHIAKVNTDEEYTPYTIAIKDDLMELQKTIIKVIQEVRNQPNIYK